MAVSANANTLNIKTFMENTECCVYGVPNTFNRFNHAASRVYGFFWVSSGITVNFDFKHNNEYIRRTLLNTCLESNNNDINTMESFCTHWSNSKCTNGTISMPSIIHHTNVYNVMNQIPNSTTNYAVMLLAPNALCFQDTNQHKGVAGKCWPASKKLIVQDWEYIVDDDYSTNIKDFDCVAYEMVHEIGHLYGVQDHYNNSYGVEKDNCIWGKNKYDENIYRSLIMCDDCSQILKNNKSKFNHTPIN